MYFFDLLHRPSPNIFIAQTSSKYIYCKDLLQKPFLNVFFPPPKTEEDQQNTFIAQNQYQPIQSK